MRKSWRLGEAVALLWILAAGILYTSSGQWRTQRILDATTRYLPFLHVVLLTSCVYLFRSVITSAERLRAMGRVVREGTSVPVGDLGLAAEATLLRRMARFVRDCAPVYGFLVFYPTSDFFIDWLQGGKLADAWLADLDLLVFGGHVSVWMERFVTPLRTEVLSLCYVLHMIIPPLVVLVIGLRGSRQRFVQVVDAFVLISVIGVSLYVLVPATGPKDHLAHLYTRDLAGGVIDQVNRTLVDATRVPRDAFPSLHVGVSALMLLHAWRSSRALGLAVLPFIAGNWVATLYLRYHYAVDVIAGLLLVVLVEIVVRDWHQRFPVTDESQRPSIQPPPRQTSPS